MIGINNEKIQSRKAVFYITVQFHQVHRLRPVQVHITRTAHIHIGQFVKMVAEHTDTQTAFYPF